MRPWQCLGAALGLMAVTLSAPGRQRASYELRRQTLASLVKVRATDCPRRRPCRQRLCAGAR